MNFDNGTVHPSFIHTIHALSIGKSEPPSGFGRHYFADLSIVEIQHCAKSRIAATDASEQEALKENPS